MSQQLRSDKHHFVRPQLPLELNIKYWLEKIKKCVK